MNGLADHELKTIIARRDRRFDGRFYFGVKTTGIYCRPVCPAKPKPENIVLFKSLSAAETAGFRPCLRCRPDAAPGNRLWDGTIATVGRALRLIQESADGDLTLARLAASLGITDRHLRRLFDEHLGASPVAIMITQRLHFAKQALRETAMPITEIAFASGFQSIRRFNEAFKIRFHRSPAEFRKTRSSGASGPLTLRIPIRLPYDWRSVIAYLKDHEIYGVEKITDNTYQRFVPRKGGFGSIHVTLETGQDSLAVQMTDLPILQSRFILARLKNLFDTDHNPSHLAAAKAPAPNGIRVPGSFDPFETAVFIIANGNLKRVVQRFGRKLGRHDADDVFAFPPPATLAKARLEKVGMPKRKAVTIRALARALSRGTIDFRAPIEFSAARLQLLRIKGLSPRLAMLISMRCLGDPDAFPAKGAGPSAWSPFKAYLTHCYWRTERIKRRTQ